MTVLRCSHASNALHVFVHLCLYPYKSCTYMASASAHVFFSRMSLSSWGVLTFLGFICICAHSPGCEAHKRRLMGDCQAHAGHSRPLRDAAAFAVETSYSELIFWGFIFSDSEAKAYGQLSGSVHCVQALCCRIVQLKHHTMHLQGTARHFYRSMHIGAHYTRTNARAGEHTC